MQFKRYMCVVCGWIYDEEHGAPKEDIAPATQWAEMDEDWVCPECGAGREDFGMTELE